MEPANALDHVRRLAADEERCELYKPVLDEIVRHGLDSEDLRDIIMTELGEVHCFKSKATEKVLSGNNVRLLLNLGRCLRVSYVPEAADCQPRS